jgi:hypothetical protein
MCSSNIIKSTVEGAVAGGVVAGPPGAIVGATVAAAGATAEEIIPTPETEKLPPQPDEKAETERARRRNLRRLVAGRPGAGRRTTQRVVQGTGTGPTGLKQKTGQ